MFSIGNVLITSTNDSHTMRRGGCSMVKVKTRPSTVSLGVPGTVSPLVLVDVADNIKEVP